MSLSHEPVTLRFRGHERTLPLMSLATALPRELEHTATLLEILIHGPEADPTSPNPQASPPGDACGEGEGGGARSGTLDPRTFEQNPEERSERSDARDHLSDADLAKHIAREIGDEENEYAIRKLVLRFPRALVEEARRRTLAVPPERVRTSRGALFTGIIRKLGAN